MQAREAGPVPPAPLTIAGAASFIGTLAAVVLSIGILLGVDLFLAGVDLSESARHAASEYARGAAQLSAGDPHGAADHFAAALAIERDNLNYALALGTAQWRGGQISDAEETLKTLLERAENDGGANLAMARVLVGEGRVGEAKPYFHRAIYGRWGADSLARRAEARFALIDLLAAHGGGRDLLAELLPLEDVPADSVALRKRLGQWFLLAGSPSRAANMFREVLRRDPKDGAAYAGMGEAALAQGNFRTARADFNEALSLLPQDTAVVARLSLADTLLAADPTARGVGSAERAVRARALIGRMMTALGPCVATTGRPAADSARAVLAETAASKAPADVEADRLTTIATDLWAAYAPACPAARTDPVLGPLGARLAQ